MAVRTRQRPVLTSSPQKLFRNPWDVESPYLLLDLDKVQANLAAVRSSFGPLQPNIFYSVKANPDPSLLAALHCFGCGFDVASIAEIRRLEELGVPPSKMTFSATVKVPSHVEQAYAIGVDRFAIDNETEIAKLAALAPESNVVLRLEVPHQGSRWPLTGKFGVPADEAVQLLRLAKRSGLTPYGLSFHVGSQCTRPETWLEAITLCSQVWDGAAEAGVRLRLLNLGGGLPSTYTEEVPTIAAIGEAIVPHARRLFGSDVEYALEPGRYMVANAGRLVATVIGTAVRKGRPWVYVDLSIYAGLLEVIGGWRYPVKTEKDHLPKRPVTLAGPSCDSTDILLEDVELPELEVGDRVQLLSAGAYTTSYREYNGYAFPRVRAFSENGRVTSLPSHSCFTGQASCP